MKDWVKRVWGRFWWDARHLFDKDDTNPYVDEPGEEPGFDFPKPRTAAQDSTHAFKNLIVEPIGQVGWGIFVMLAVAFLVAVLSGCQGVTVGEAGLGKETTR